MPDGMNSGIDWYAPTPSSQVRRPRVRVLVNGVALYGCYDCSVTSNNHLSADTWEASLAIGADPEYGWAFWGEQKEILLTIQAGFLPPGAAESAMPTWVTLITGHVDDMHIDPSQAVIQMSGRDLTSLLVDTKIQQAFPNLTTSQILTSFAHGHGLVADVTPTTRLVGTYYKDEHDKLSLGNFSKQTSEWELACYLVRQEDQDIWIDDKGLHTRPSVDPEASGVRPFPITYVSRNHTTPIDGANVVSKLSVERSLTLAKDIRVTVKTWDAAHKTSYTRTVDGKGAITAKNGSSASKGKAATSQTYVYVKPGLTPDQALRFAQQQARILTLLERIVSVEMPGELALTARALVSLTGTGTSWDQTYYVDTITRRITLQDGFTQSIRLKNSSPRTMTTVS